MTQSQQTQQFLESRHDQYIARSQDWDFYVRSYLGGRQYLDGRNLFSHRLEHRSDAARRLARSYYINHCRNVVDTMTALLFARGFELDPLPPDYLWTDADRRGNDLAQVMRRAATLSSIYGNAFLLVDVPAAGDEEPLSRRHELMLGLRPYLETIPPTQVLNWETDEGGALSWCLVREQIARRSVRAGVEIDFDDRGEEQLRLWTREGWWLYGQDAGRWKLIGEGEHALGVVPLVPIKHRDLDGGVCGDSMLHDIAVLNREVYNLSSLLQEILYRQTFGQLVAQGSAEEYVGEDESLAKLGTSSIFLYPDDRQPPSYISPNPANAEILVSQIDRLVEDIYRISNLTTPDWLGGAAAESGLARSYRFVNTSGALRDKADSVADAFERALWISSLWENAEREYTIAFPERPAEPVAVQGAASAEGE